MNRLTPEQRLQIVEIYFKNAEGVRVLQILNVINLTNLSNRIFDY